MSHLISLEVENMVYFGQNTFFLSVFIFCSWNSEDFYSVQASKVDASFVANENR